MKLAPPPAHESARLRALRSLEILDTLPEPAFDELVALASEICDVPIALMSLVDQGRQWFKAVHGLNINETRQEDMFCVHAIRGNELFVIEDATRDARFSDNPLVSGGPGIRFYAGTPIATTGGLKMGTLCVIDRKPRVLSDFQRRALMTLGKQIEAQVSLRQTVRALARREDELSAHRDSLVRQQWDREQLTSLVVHDLKAPIASVLPTANFIADDADTPADIREAAREIGMAANVMLRMVLDLLDIGRGDEGRLVPRLARVSVHGLLADIHRTAVRRANEVDQRLSMTRDVADGELAIEADADLLRRVLENVVDNAIKYAGRKGSIRLAAKPSTDHSILLTIGDDGPGIPDSQKETIFERYARMEASQHSHVSRGLGLFFARLAVEAHGGRIWVEDNRPKGTVFCIRLPIDGLVRNGAVGPD